MHVMTKDFLSQLDEALTSFGTYAFDDKGPREVLEFEAMLEDLRSLNAAEAVTVLTELSESKVNQGRGRILASKLINNMDDWDELFDFKVIVKLAQQ